jgi:tyrosine-protein kinase Etk/Wzc
LAAAIHFPPLRFTPEYKISASLLIRDDSRGADFGDAALLESLGVSTRKSSVDNEVQVLKSRTLMERVSQRLAADLSSTTQLARSKPQNSTTNRHFG